MRKVSFIFILFVLCKSNLFAQEQLFKVLVNKGKNLVDDKPLYAGSKIHAGQTLYVVDGGYLALIYKNGKSMEIKTPGIFKVADLERQAIATSGTFSKKYAELVLNEITKPNDAITIDRKKNMKVTGSVERGTESGLVMITPKNSDLLSKEVKLIWLSNASCTEGYVVKLKDMFDEPLKNYETTDTFVTVNVEELGLKNPKSFIVTLEPKQAQNKSNAEGKLVKMLEGKRAEELEREFKLVQEEAGDESALSKIILASFCEQNKLYLEAINYFEQATSIEPAVEEYKFAYQNFLDRLGLYNVKK
ncbi:MAG TPA: hypothetical protein DCR46_05640 [Cytophagales bacterium]|nr:hypothetical protein [Cytophagales bacterium]